MTPGTCEETAKVFDAVQPIDIRHVVRGQYAGYTSEPGVAPGLADRDPGRGAGRDRQLALGRSPVLPAVRQAPGRCQTVTLGFHEPPLRMFPIDAAGTPNGPRNEITIDFADRGSITAGFLAKEPGAAMRLSAAEMTFRYADSFPAASTLEGYQRLLLDAILTPQAHGARSQRWTTSPRPITGTCHRPPHPSETPSPRSRSAATIYWSLLRIRRLGVRVPTTLATPGGRLHKPAGAYSCRVSGDRPKRKW